MDKTAQLGALRKALEGIVDDIVDTDIRDFTREMLEVLPDAYWLRPASTRYHLLDERGLYGNLKHTIRVVHTVDVVCSIVGDSFPQLTRDMLKSAAILHDGGRHGLLGDSDTSLPNHPKLPRELAEQKGISCEHSNRIFNLIELHMGRWGESPLTPLIDPWAVLHLADVFCASSQVIFEL